MKGFVLKPHEAQALAAGKPVVIWRACKPQPVSTPDGEVTFFDKRGSYPISDAPPPFPVGVPLFGKETWRGVERGDFHNLIKYKADGAEVMYPPGQQRYWQVGDMSRWRSPSHLPEWASRITLTLSDVKVRRPCDVTEEEAKAIVEFHDGPMNFCYRNSANSKVAYKTARDAFQRGFEVQYGERLALYHFTALATPQPKDS